LQAKLLRTLQQNEIVRLGGGQPLPVDVRVIAASNIDLLTETKKSNFRKDLYYRLNVVEIFIPPLRQRIEDLMVLIDHIMTRQCQEMGIRKPKISNEAIEIMTAYHWPGNVRELENCIERALLLSQGKAIRKSHLSIRQSKKSNQVPNGGGTLRIAVRDKIESALNQCNRNVTLAAKELQIGRSTLYRKIKEFGLS
jgi:Nif-specific regulatory protein